MPGGRTIAIVGAGAGGTLTAVELLRVAELRCRPLRVILVDPQPHGPGLAYSTTDPQHVLNVPAGGMSARCGDPRHFVRWSRGRGLPGGDDDFVPRLRYGRYLEDLLVEAQWRAGGDLRLDLCAREAIALRGRRVVLADETSIEADAIVLALGNPPPGIPEALAPHPRVVADPWARGGIDRIERPGRVLLVGTGLTMVDVALTLAQRFPAAQLVAFSRNGLVARAHTAEPVKRAPPVVDPFVPLTLQHVLDNVGRAIAADPPAWRSVVDGLRPVTQAIWQSLSLADRRRFLAEHARWWEVHRHRTAPAVATGLDELTKQGRLTTAAAHLNDAHPARDGLTVELDGRAATFSHVVNCTGPDLDVRRSRNALVRDLLTTGRARSHPLALGFDVDADGALINAGGQADERALVVGTLRRGALYETTAVPELRQQAARVAELLLGERRAGRPVAASRAPALDLR